jgi:hypothetical protein
MPARTMNNRGVTLMESLIGILLLSVTLIGIIGAYYLSPYAVNRSKHIAKANSILRDHMEQERAAGYTGGSLISGVLDSYYFTMPLSTGGFKNVTIDDRGTTSDESDDIIGVLSCSPWSTANYQYQTSPGGDLKFDGVRYKIAGFVLSWTEKAPLTGQSQAYSVRTASYVCEH